jgi:hypothetical protein
MVAACSSDKGNPNVLRDCWTPADFSLGDTLHGEGIALYSPTGPLLIENDCQSAQFITLFANKDLERATLRRMERESTGQWYGGQAYSVRYEGVAGRRSQYYDGIDIIISRIEILRPVDYPSAGNSSAAIPN